MMDRSNPIGLQTLALAGCLVATSWCGTSPAATPTPQAALSLKPVQAADVDYELVAKDAQDKCVVEDIKRKGWTGWEVVAADGTMLRRFADTNGDNKIDLWSYFNFGIEVYRDIDANHNRQADQHRWFHSAGSRWGINVDEDEEHTIDQWKSISADTPTGRLLGRFSSSPPPVI